MIKLQTLARSCDFGDFGPGAGGPFCLWLNEFQYTEMAAFRKKFNIEKSYYMGTAMEMVVL